MFIEERHQNIMQLLNEKGRVEVQELSALFHISDDSIRRDLRLMEQKGLLKKTYGGAVLLDKTGYYPPYSERLVLNNADKEDIAFIASGFIQENDSIFLDGSTTVAKLVPYLSKFKNIKIFTNSVTIACDIINAENMVDLVLIGGIVHRKMANTLGVDTLRDIEKLNVDKVFAAPCAISPEWGLSCSSNEEAPLKKALLHAGRQVYLLAESDKFGKRALIQFAPLKAEYTVITDTRLSADVLKEFSEYINKGMQIINSNN